MHSHLLTVSYYFIWIFYKMFQVDLVNLDLRGPEVNVVPLEKVVELDHQGNLDHEDQVELRAGKEDVEKLDKVANKAVRARRVLQALQALLVQVVPEENKVDQENQVWVAGLVELVNKDPGEKEVLPDKLDQQVLVVRLDHKVLKANKDNGEEVVNVEDLDLLVIFLHKIDN